MYTMIFSFFVMHNPYGGWVDPEYKEIRIEQIATREACREAIQAYRSGVKRENIITAICVPITYKEKPKNDTRRLP